MTGQLAARWRVTVTGRSRFWSLDRRSLAPDKDTCASGNPTSAVWKPHSMLTMENHLAVVFATAVGVSDVSGPFRVAWVQ